MSFRGSSSSPSPSPSPESTDSLSHSPGITFLEGWGGSIAGGFFLGMAIGYCSAARDGNAESYSSGSMGGGPGCCDPSTTMCIGGAAECNPFIALCCAGIVIIGAPIVACAYGYQMGVALYGCTHERSRPLASQEVTATLGAAAVTTTHAYVQPAAAAGAGGYGATDSSNPMPWKASYQAATAADKTKNQQDRKNSAEEPMGYESP